MEHYKQPFSGSVDPQNIYRTPLVDYQTEDPCQFNQSEPQQSGLAQLASQVLDETSRVYAAVYSGVPVFEMMCRNVAVMRRRADSYLNATQILKVAGIDKGRRTKILEKEILGGCHEKVQGGYGKYQGTWIPFERGVHLADRFLVAILLSPLFEYTAPTGVNEKPPTKEQVLSHYSGGPGAVRKAGPYRARKSTSTKEGAAPKRKKTESQPYPHEMQQHGMDFNGNELSGSNANDEYLTHFYNNYPSASMDMDHSYGMVTHTQMPMYYMQMPMVEPPSERHRSTLMAMFMNDDDSVIPEILLPHLQPPSDFDIDLSLDDQGHTALHWAAALGRITLLNLLIQKGANPHRININGESALMRAVMVSNNFDQHSFPTLLNILKELIPAVDKKYRSILHHTSSVSSVKTCAPSCRYYMDCLLDFMSKESKIGQVEYSLAHGHHDIRNPLENVMEIINYVDVCGDTPLNIAARIGNQYLVDVLLNYGADANITNKVGLRPSDFGFAGLYIANPQAPGLELPQINTEIALAAEGGAQHTAHIVYPSIQTEGENESSQQTKMDTVPTQPDFMAETHVQLKDMSRELNKVRKQNEEFRNQQAQIPQLKLRIQGLESSLFCQTRDMANIQIQIPRIKNSDDIMEEVESYRRLLMESDAKEKQLLEELQSLQSNSGEMEQKCKRVISACCSIPLDQVTKFIPFLLEAIESDGPDMQAERVASLLAQIKKDDV